jgi:hypothetical protein
MGAARARIQVQPARLIRFRQPAGPLQAFLVLEQFHHGVKSRGWRKSPAITRASFRNFATKVMRIFQPQMGTDETQIKISLNSIQKRKKSSLIHCNLQKLLF